VINKARIQTICSFVVSPVVAEIGADHGLITKNLFENKIIKKAYLTDLRAICLKKAEDNFALTEYNKNCVFLVGDGLQPLNNLSTTLQKEIGQIIIAGMGGQEIKKILKNNTNPHFVNFVLQPQRNVVELRKFLQQNNYEIVYDVLSREDNHFYNVLSVIKRLAPVKPLSTKEELFGKTNLVTLNAVFKDYLMYRMQKLQTFKTEDEKILEEIKQIKEVLTLF